MNRCIYVCSVFIFILAGQINAQDSLNISAKDSIKIANLEKRIKLLEVKYEKDELDKFGTDRPEPRRTP